MPRKRWHLNGGELSYRKPYLSGRCRNYAFWIHSPSNPQTYAFFFKTHGQKIVKKLDPYGTTDPCSYHWKILPRENRYRESIIYIHNRAIGPLTLRNAYGASYQIKNDRSQIYVERYDGEARARAVSEERTKTIRDMGIDLQKKSLMINGETWHWPSPKSG